MGHTRLTPTQTVLMKKEEGETLSIEGREVRITHPDKPYFSRDVKLSKLDLVRYYLVGRAAARSPASAIARSCSSASSTAPRASRSIRSARRTSGPTWLRTVTLSFPSGRTAEEVVVDDAAGLAWIVNLGCIELHPHAGARRRSRSSRRAAHRSRSRPGRRVGRRAPGRDGGEGAARGARASRLAEDERLARHARQRAHRAALDVHRGAARGAGVLARDRAARADARDLEVVEGGAPRRLPRLQPERQGSHDLLGVLGAAAARRARVGAARPGTRFPTASRPTSRC